MIETVACHEDQRILVGGYERVQPYIEGWGFVTATVVTTGDGRYGAALIGDEWYPVFCPFKGANDLYQWVLDNRD